MSASTAAAIFARGAAKFAGDVNESILKESTILQVIHERSDGRIKLIGIALGTLGDGLGGCRNILQNLDKPQFEAKSNYLMSLSFCYWFRCNS